MQTSANASASQYDAVGVVTLLLNRGAAVNALDANGSSALFYLRADIVSFGGSGNVMLDVLRSRLRAAGGRSLPSSSLPPSVSRNPHHASTTPPPVSRTSTPPPPSRSGSIRVHVHVRVVVLDPETEREACAVCLSPLGAEGTVSRAPCGHMLHTACWGMWVRVKPNCPLCSASILCEPSLP
jgi:Ring finger domain